MRDEYDFSNGRRGAVIARRGFLAGVLAAGVAPAIVHNPMRLYVPRRMLTLPRYYIGSGTFAQGLGFWTRVGSTVLVTARVDALLDGPPPFELLDVQRLEQDGRACLLGRIA